MLKNKINISHLFGLLVHVFEFLLLRRPRDLVAREAVEASAMRPRLVEQYVLIRRKSKWDG